MTQQSADNQKSSPNGDVYHFEYLQLNKCCGKISPHTKIAEINLAIQGEEDKHLISAHRADIFYKKLAQCKDLEVLRIAWTNIDTDVISQLKNLKTLEITQYNGISHSGYAFEGNDLKALGSLPKLENLRITAFGLTDDDMKSIVQQFPNLKTLYLKATSVSRKGAELLDKHLPDFEVDHRHEGCHIKKSLFEQIWGREEYISKQTLAEERAALAEAREALTEAHDASTIQICNEGAPSDNVQQPTKAPRKIVRQPKKPQEIICKPDYSLHSSSSRGQKGTFRRADRWNKNRSGLKGRGRNDDEEFP